jgi:O-antigen/teichoic acid export membrane protein
MSDRDRERRCIAMHRRQGNGVTILATARTIALSILSSDVLRGSAAALAIKFTGSILGFAMFALAAQSMLPHAFGTLAVIFNAMCFLAVIANCGQETLIVRSWDEYLGTDRSALAIGALAFSIKVVAAGGLLVAVLTAVTWPFLQVEIGGAIVLAACGFLAMQAFMNFSAQFARVAAGVVVGEIPREILWRTVVVVAIVTHLVLGTPFTAIEFFTAAAAAMALSILLQQLFVARAVRRASIAGRREREYDIAAWVPRSLRMWVAAMLDTSSQYLEVIAIGFFLGPTAAAFYFVATRITNVFAMISGSITAYATSQISSLFHGNAKAELQAVLRSLSMISATLAVGAFVVIAFGGKLLLWVFGPVYVSAYPALLVLAAGASVVALAGPAPYLLLLTGNEGLYPRITAWGLLSRLVLIAVLGPWLGLMGAAIAWSVSAIGMALASVICCRRRIGIDPSFLGVLLRPRVLAPSLTGSPSR